MTYDEAVELFESQSSIDKRMFISPIVKAQWQDPKFVMDWRDRQFLKRGLHPVLPENMPVSGGAPSAPPSLVIASEPEPRTERPIITERIERQRTENLRQNEEAFAKAQHNAPPEKETPVPYNMRPPPPPPMPEPDYPVMKVEYSEKVVDLAVMSLEEAQEFAENLWQEHEGKNSLDDTKKVYDALDNAKSAHDFGRSGGRRLHQNHQGA
ncbi:hypothetical protein TUMSATVNIG1_57250 (plasmid) [Vibrio nigripulchritudo]|uniref:hypothetical protein n=1 Tax=Vibrio nigripulchritudo TaxID=28173 RepID=UPI00190BFDD5|nr:hypothetical protein [Vibrio nigripulchritudo]BCL73741.1 hypothetical protein VNTUMSATTG_56780 [Vibrio nigripulchritudo]BDU35116.1 hypothetical protein TUMSATVNIG1_57250 [Vibrio nigripulchritudo]